MSLNRLETYRYTRFRWRAFFSLVDRLGETLFAAFRNENSVHAEPDPNQILVIQLDHLGDAILSRSFLQTLRERYPSACIEVLCGAWNREWFESLPEVDQARVLTANRFGRDWRARCWCWIPALLWTALHLRSRRYDLAIDIRGEFPHALLMWLTGARRRVGWNAGGGGFLLTHSAVYIPRRAELASRASLLRALGISPRGALALGSYDPGEAARDLIAARLTNVAATPPLVVVHVGAGTSAKRWPAQRWRELALRLIVERGATVILVGARGEGDPVRFPSWLEGSTVLSQRGSTVRVEPHRLRSMHDWRGTLGIRELAALLARAELFVGADSGPAHLAALMNTPSVTLFSGTNDVEQWRPRNPRTRVLRAEVSCSPCHHTSCPLADHPCMTGLSVERVLAACGEVLASPVVSATPETLRPVVAQDGAVAVQRGPVDRARTEAACA